MTSLDQIAWNKVIQILTDPAVIERELDRLGCDDPSAEELAIVERSLASIERSRTNVARAIISIDEADTAAPLVAELQSLAARSSALQQKRELITARRANWESARERLQDLAQWCQVAGRNLEHFPYQDKRDALYALNLQAAIYRRGSQPRYAITVDVPFERTPDIGQGPGPRIVTTASRTISIAPATSRSMTVTGCSCRGRRPVRWI